MNNARRYLLKVNRNLLKTNKDEQQGMHVIGENNCCIPPTLEGWVYIIPIHGSLDGPLYALAQYTPTPPAV